MGRKTQLHLYVDGEVAELAKLKFPGKLSSYIESYLRTLLEIEEVDNIVNNEEKRLQQLTEQEAQLKREKKIILERKKMRKQEEIKAEHEMIFKRAEMMKRDNPARWD